MKPYSVCVSVCLFVVEKKKKESYDFILALALSVATNKVNCTEEISFFYSTTKQKKNTEKTAKN